MQEIGLAKALTKQGYQCGIVLYNGKNKDCIETIPVSWEGHTESITIYRLHGYNLLKNGIFPSLNKIAKQYDVIQVHEYDQLTSWWYYAWKKQPVVIYHGPFYSSFNKGYNLKCKVFDYTFLKFKSGKKIPCLTKSKSAAAFLEKKGFRNVIAAGVGLDAENMQIHEIEQSIVQGKKQDIPVDENKFTLLYVGKIEERRNSLFLIELLREIDSRNLNIQFIIIGSGEKEYVNIFLTQLQPYLDSKLACYYPFATQSELAGLYQMVQLLVFPTHYDIYGMVLQEAMYFHLPITSSPNGATDMLIENGVNGFIQDGFDVRQWVDSIQNLWQNKEKYRQLKTKLAEQSREQLKWDYLAHIFMNQYKKAINEVKSIQ